MKGLILAAGIGSRLQPLTNEKPKPLIEINGKPIIKSIIENLIYSDITDILIITGYKESLIIDSLKEESYFNNLKFILNKDYETTNNIASFLLGIDEIEEDIILYECDIIVDKNLIKKLVKIPNSTLVSKYNPAFMDGTTVNIVNDLITEIGTDGQFEYKTINVYNLTFKTLNLIKKIANILYESSSYYESLIKVLIDLRLLRLKPIIVHQNNWIEIDTYKDLIRAETLANLSLDKLWGGYWNYDFIDMSLFTNPYFPNKSLNSLFTTMSKTLISSYSSTQNYFEKIASSVYPNAGFKYVIPLNGTSQLIKLLPYIFKDVSVVIPTFNEYLHEEYKQIFLHELLNSKLQFNTLLITNPGNPFPNIVLNTEIKHFIDAETNIIFDESFMDFSPENSAFNLENKDNIHIIKSLGKTHGIPGIRLGLFFTNNELIYNKVSKLIPVWNLNSFAQFYLEVFARFKNSYFDSLKKWVLSSNELIYNLNNLNYKLIYNNKLPYFLIKLSDHQIKYLKKNNILIRDIRHKTEGFCRVTSKDSNINLKFFDILNKAN